MLNIKQSNSKPIPSGSFFLGENAVLLKQLLQNQADPLRPGHVGTGSSIVKRKIITICMPTWCTNAPDTCTCHGGCCAQGLQSNL